MTTPSGSMELHHQSVVVEAHRDCYEFVHWLGQGEEHPLADRTIPRLRAGGVDVCVYAISGDSLAHARGTERRLLATLANIDAFYRDIEEGTTDAAVVLDRDDIPEVSDGTVHFVLHLEGGGPLEGKLSSLRCLYRLGLRSMQLAWNGRNEIADGVMEARTEGGLTEFGVTVVQEMNRLGMVVDVAHLAEAGFWQTMEIAEGPLIASHANSKTIMDHPRNITDSQATAVAKKGGVVGVQTTPRVVSEIPSLDAFVRHIEHYCDLIGPEHVGLGLDFSLSDGPRPPTERLYPGKRGPLPGLEEADSLPVLTEALVSRNLSDDDISGILGANFCRVFREVLPARFHTSQAQA